jgi:signal transduction histidine kinase
LATVQAVEQTLDLAFVREDLPKLLTESREGLARVRRIVEDLRNFSRADDGAWQQADLNALVESALGVVANALKGKAEVVRQLQPELPPVHCLSAQLSQVLVNLLVNAAQAITTHGSVSVRTGTLASGVWLEVADTGCGMTEEVQKRMFEPFFTTKPVGQGTGLGLSITWEILQRHRAQVAVRSAPGQGTTIHIDFPADPSPRTPHV